MQGVRFSSGDETVRDFLSRWPEAERLYWYLDVYSSPFASLALGNEEAANAENTLLVHLPSASRPDSSPTMKVGVWAPGTFPRMARDLILDEQSYLIGFSAEPCRIPAIAEELARMPTLNDGYFARVEQLAEILIVYFGPGAEFYSPHRQLLQECQDRYHGDPVDSHHWSHDAADAMRMIRNVIESQ